ncbi:MAG: GumC family protein [Gemmobacter sp.]
MDVRFYLSLILRRLPWIALFVALGTAVGLAVATVLPPVYVAQARLLLESEQIPGTLAASTVQTQATEQLQIIQQRIQTRASLLELSNRMQVYANSTRRLNPDEIVEDMRRRIQISVSGSGPRTAQSRGQGAQAVFVTVSFEAPTAAMSTTVTNELVSMILAENVRLRTTVSGQTLEFFNQEVERLDRELAIRSARILEFKNANQEALPDSLDFRRRQEALEQERLIVLERDLAALRDRRARLVHLFETTGQVAAPANAPQTVEQRQLVALRDQLTQALAVYTPQNPRVRMIEAQIARLEPVVAAQMSGAGASGADAQLTAFQLQMADIDGQIAQIEDQRGRVLTSLDRLKTSIEATPANAIALEALERDYANTRSQYDQAVAARARAQTGDTIETLAKGQRISIIEQAVTPRQPARPNRTLIAAGGVGFGLALAAGFVLLLELTNRAIRRPVDLTRKLGIAPFATLPYTRTRREARLRTLAITTALIVVLGGIPAGIWAVDRYVRPLDQIIDQAMRQTGLDEGLARLRARFGD